jgi:transposase
MVEVGSVGTGDASSPVAGPRNDAARFDRDSSASTCRWCPQKDEPINEALGRSRGGFSCKLHIAVDAQGQAVELRLGPGEEHDVTRAPELLGEYEPGCVIGDKGYDSDELVMVIRERGAEAVIPPRSNRTTKRHWNKKKYKRRNLVERFVNRIKHYRRVATRFDKTARNYLAFVHLASSLVMLGVTVNMT